MIDFSSTLKAALFTAPDKSQWCARLITSLGTSPHLRIFHDASANATDPASSGTEVVNAQLTGGLSSSAGDITGFGIASNMTVRHAADLLSGTSVLRIENGGDWLQGSTGLSRAAQSTAGVLDADLVDYDFPLSANPSASTGIGFASGAILHAPRELSSGIGPAAPAKTDDMLHTFELWDWSNMSAPSLTATTSIDTQNDNFTYQHTAMAQSTGDCAWWNCSNSLMWGVYEFAPHLFISAASNTESGTQPLQQLMIVAAYHGTWTDYPTAPHYDKLNHFTCPGPFKIVGKDKNGNVVHTFQMQDGKPINDPTIWAGNIKQPDGSLDANKLIPTTLTNALRPKWNIAMSLYWHNETPSRNALAAHLYPGIADNTYRPTSGHYYLISNGNETLYDGGGTGGTNTMQNLYAAPQWPKPRAPWTPGVLDPYCNYNVFNSSSYGYWAWSIGYDYEPGSNSLHNWFTGPGGVRFDRCALPSALAIWLTYPNGIRPQDNVAWKDVAMGWIKAYANHSNHFYRDPKRLHLDTNAMLMANNYCVLGQYYGDWSDDLTSPYAIRINGDQADGTSLDNFDANGDMIYSGWGRDYLHGYSQAGWAALLLNSPAHAIMGKKDLVYMMMLNHPRDGARDGYYMHRRMAWHWLAFAVAWPLASTDELGFTQQQIEDKLAECIEKIYNDVYVRCYVNHETDLFSTGLRNLNHPIIRYDGDPTTGITNGGQLACYLGHVLQLMKQTGFWDRMYAKGGHIRTVLDMILMNFDNYTCGLLLDTKWCQIYTGYSSIGKVDDNGIPASWVEWQAQWGINDGRDQVHNADGSVRNIGDIEVSDNLVIQYLYIRRDFFPEFPSARLADAIAKVEYYDAIITQAVGTTSDASAKVQQDRCYRLPGSMRIKAPATVGA